jgi:hypothetical protein
MTKHISLNSFSYYNPVIDKNESAVMILRKQGKVEFELPEWLFDMDYPGHYFRRIKSVSVSIPCIAGPYTTVACKLTLQSSKYRYSPIVQGGEYDKEENYTTIFSGGQSIATSNAQNDSGMFEFNFKDERYLPFEGAGAISRWTLELPSSYAQFDYNTISDVILHIKYTARFDGGLALGANGAKSNLDKVMGQTETPTNEQGALYRIFSLKHEFANEWNKFVTDVANEVVDPTLDIPLKQEMFPYFCKNKTIGLIEAVFELQTKDGETIAPFNIADSNIDLDIAGISTDISIVKGATPLVGEIDGNTPLPVSLTFDAIPNLENIRDLYFAVIYKLS